jgi:CheY-like chemotaxis protein
LLTREPARAFVELERDGALAVLVDMATLGAEQFCKRARGTERLRSVPVIGMSRHPNELGFARVFAWGADDLVPLGARLPLERRLQVLRDTPPSAKTGFGQAVVAEATTQRRALVGRVLSHAGYDVKFAVDRGAVELYASQAETRLVVISAALGDPRRIIEAAARAGALPTWIVTVEARSTQRLAASLAGLERVAVTSTAGAPEDVLFLANELVFSKGQKRREWRALYATPIAFRPEGGDGDEYGFSYDASPSGLYVRSLLPCATERVEVELRLPNRDERVRLHGKVARRFAFGSGAIASAPPGFSVKFDGPEAALARWTESCTELINAASTTESLPPPARPRVVSQPVLASPELGGKEVPLAVPPATVSIESVVAPLPVAVQAAVEAGSDVGELLAATLDEETLTQVGARPVTIDPDTLGVREERLSEFGAGPASLADSPPASLPAPLEPTISLPPVPMPALVPERTPAPAASAIPRPVPRPESPSTTLLSTPSPLALKSDAPEPETPRSAGTERPALGSMGTLLLEPAPRPAPPSEPETPAPKTPGGTLIMRRGDDDVPAPQAMDWEADAKTTVRSSQPNIEVPAPATPPTPLTPPTPAPLAVREPLSPEFEAARAFDASATLPLAQAPDNARSPAPRAVEDAFAPTEPPPPMPEATTNGGFETGRVATNAAPAPLAAPSVSQTLPLGSPRQPLPSTPEVARTLQSATPAKTTAKSRRRSNPPPRSTAARVILFIAAAVGATAFGMGVALVTHRAPSAAPAPHPAEPVAQNPTATAVAAPATPENTAATAAPSGRMNASAAPLATDSAPLASAAATNAATPASASAAVSHTSAEATPPGAPAATVVPAATAAEPPAAAATPAAANTPPVAAPSFDVRKLPRDRAGLIVHSSANTHVFVHGVDYGSTNQALTTSCGIRFVRLGSGNGNFLGAGQSYVIKCGKLNELSIEP